MAGPAAITLYPVDNPLNSAMAGMNSATGIYSRLAQPSQSRQTQTGLIPGKTAGGALMNGMGGAGTGAAIGGMVAGGEAGSAAGPWGAAIGAGVGLLAYLLS